MASAIRYTFVQNLSLLQLPLTVMTLLAFCRARENFDSFVAKF